MITFIVPGKKSRAVICDGCGRNISESDAYHEQWRHFGTKRTKRGVPIGGKDFCPRCQKKYHIGQPEYLAGVVEQVARRKERGG